MTRLGLESNFLCSGKTYRWSFDRLTGTFCVYKRLAMIEGNRSVGMDCKARRGIAMFDRGFCWGIPVTFVALRKSSDSFPDGIQ